jgi:hypothetical protein
MKKIIRLTESDLTRIVKRTIKEMDENDYTADDAIAEIGSYIDMVGCSEGRSRLLDDLSRMVDEAERELSEEEFDKLMNYVYDLEREIYETCSDEEEEETFYESDLTRIVNRVIKENDNSSENIEESFDPMVGIDNFLNNPIMITLATAWLLSGKFKVSNLKSNLEEMKNDFLGYSNSMGYSIDKEILDLKFKQLIHRIKNIINL